MFTTGREIRMTLGDDDFGKIFFISNAADMIYHHDHCYVDISHPMPEELSAPSLVLSPVDESKAEEFWQIVSISYATEALSPELMAALKGESEQWKLIRCCPQGHDDDNGNWYSFFLVLANATAYRNYMATHEDLDLGHGLEADMERGVVYLHIVEECGLKIEEKHFKKKHSKKGKLETYATYTLRNDGQWLNCSACSKHFMRLVRVHPLEEIYEYSVYEECRYL